MINIDKTIAGFVGLETVSGYGRPMRTERNLETAETAWNRCY